MKRRIALSLFFLFLSWTQNLVAVHSSNFKGKTFQLNFGQCNLLSAMWRVTSFMWHVQTSNMWNIIYYRDVLHIFPLITLFWIYITNSPTTTSMLDKKNLLKPKYDWTQTPHLVASTNIRGWNLYPNRDDKNIQKYDRTCLIWKIVWLKLTSLHLIHDTFTLLGHIKKSVVSNQACFILS